MKYQVKKPVVLRDGIVQLENSIAKRCARSLKPVKGKKSHYEVVGDLHLKVGALFDWDGNIKRLTKFVVEVEKAKPDPVDSNE